MKRRKKKPTDSTFNWKMADEILDAIITGSEGLRNLAKLNPHWPDPKIIYRWRHQHPEFSRKWEMAKQAQIQVLMDEIIDIADDRSKDYYINDEGEQVYNRPHVNRCRIMIDTRKWLASKLLPRMYGDYKAQDADGNHIDVMAELLKLRKEENE